MAVLSGMRIPGEEPGQLFWNLASASTRLMDESQPMPSRWIMASMEMIIIGINHCFDCDEASKNG